MSSFCSAKALSSFCSAKASHIFSAKLSEYCVFNLLKQLTVSSLSYKALNNWAQIVLISMFLLFQLHDKDMRIRQERSEKERMKDYFNQRLEINNAHWEMNWVSTRSRFYYSDSLFCGQTFRG